MNKVEVVGWIKPLAFKIIYLEAHVAWYPVREDALVEAKKIAHLEAYLPIWLYGRQVGANDTGIRISFRHLDSPKASASTYIEDTLWIL